MKLAIICGSHRKNSQSKKVGAFISNKFEKSGNSTYLLDLGENPLPLWDEGVWSNEKPWSELLPQINSSLNECDAAVLISPEYSGMASPAIKNFTLLLGGAAGALSHKPVLLCGVSSSRGGSYPIAELRSSSYKNTRLCLIPEHLIIRDAESMLNTDQPTNNDDIYIQKRIDYSLNLLGEYAKALKQVRASGVIDAKAYPNGM